MGRFINLILLLTLTLGAAWSEEVYCRYFSGDPTDSRLMIGQDNMEYYGLVEGDVIHQLSAAPWNHGKPTGHTIPVDKVKLLHPCEPVKIIGMSGTYKDAWEEGQTPFNTVRWFLKPPTSAASPNETIVLPAAVNELLVETELAIVIGKRVKNATIDEAKEAIFGYTIANDMVGSMDSYHKIQNEPRDQKETLLGFALKHGDKFTPFGPFIYTDVDWKNRERTLVVTTPSTGEQKVYKHNTSNLYYTPQKIVSDLSRVFSLEPGDLILTGTTKALPAKAGDKMEVTVEGLGSITNYLAPTMKE